MSDRASNDVRNFKPFFRNYDYGGPDEPSDTSPGRGLFNGPMDKYKSIGEFLDKKRKARRKKKSIAQELTEKVDEFLDLTNNLE